MVSTTLLMMPKNILESKRIYKKILKSRIKEPEILLIENKIQPYKDRQ